VIATPTTSRKRQKQEVSKDYLKLVMECPLRTIRSKDDHAAAMKVLDGLVGREDLSEGQLDYVEALAHFVADYERESLNKHLRELTPSDVVRHLMEANGMNTSDLGEVLGGRGLASEVLMGSAG